MQSHEKCCAASHAIVAMYATLYAITLIVLHCLPPPPCCVFRLLSVHVHPLTSSLEHNFNSNIALPLYMTDIPLVRNTTPIEVLFTLPPTARPFMDMVILTSSLFCNQEYPTLFPPPSSSRPSTCTAMPLVPATSGCYSPSLVYSLISF
jgi:hypothetical protein